MVTNKEFDELSDRLYALEDNFKEIERVPALALDPRFEDLLAACIESLMRARSQGAYQMAVALHDKYGAEGSKVTDYGEQFVRTGELYSGGKQD